MDRSTRPTSAAPCCYRKRSRKSASTEKSSFGEREADPRQQDFVLEGQGIQEPAAAGCCRPGHRSKDAGTLSATQEEKEKEKETVKRPDGQLITITEKEITADDVGKLDKLSLTDYNVDFDSVEVPRGQPISDDDMKHAFSSFLQTIEDA
ncbi:hypothetical protein MRX60_12860 (plasmid) [Xylella fastidiosa subsp. pauca]|uniref:hypothetical protein n=1 Tax=Xylella fastidiosa TaxID=2371 RepID=UPI00241BF03C|nr:hypothetical protein [Xylella fastidiosa]MDG5826886.1 hypothetical protein [Xylella fastidiosa subsp. pauca]MDG5826921.1 hypothetical protein [Xylella fastidiosa subsp. pauca]